MLSSKSHLIIAIILAISLLLVGCSSPPDETEVREFFNSERAILERILEMSNEDYAKSKVIRIAPSFTRLEDNWGWPRPESEWGISTARWNEYRNLFSSAGLPDGINRDGEGKRDVYFPVWSEGLADNARERGMMFSPIAPSDVQGGSQRIVYKPLSGNWYYYEWVTW
jgi:hypothetical protein